MAKTGTSTLNSLLSAHPLIATSPFETCFVVAGGGLKDLTRAVSDDYSSMRLDDALARFEQLMKVDLCSPRSYPFNQLDLAGVFGRDVYPRLVDEYFQQLGVVKYKGDGLTIAPRVRVGNLAGPYKLKRIRLPWWVGRSRQYLFAAPRLPREAAVRAARQFVANLYHERMTATGAVVWCDQTTNNLIDADFWFDMFPEALFLHIVRDPLDVAIAHHLQDWAPDDFALTCRIIRANYARWSEVRSCIPPGSYLELRFEDIVKEPGRCGCENLRAPRYSRTDSAGRLALARGSHGDVAEQLERGRPANVPRNTRSRGARPRLPGGPHAAPVRVATAAALPRSRPNPLITMCRCEPRNRVNRLTPRPTSQETIHPDAARSDKVHVAGRRVTTRPACPSREGPAFVSRPFPAACHTIVTLAADSSPLPGATVSSINWSKHSRGPRYMATVQVRYIVNNVDEAIDFYCRLLDFHEDMHPAPAFAMLSRGDLRLVLSMPNSMGGGGQPMPDGTSPAPGGWNRFTIEVQRSRSQGCRSQSCRRPLPQRNRPRRWREPESSSMTPPATRSNSSSPPFPKPASTGSRPPFCRGFCLGSLATRTSRARRARWPAGITSGQRCKTRDAAAVQTPANRVDRPPSRRAIVDAECGIN